MNKIIVDEKDIIRGYSEKQQNLVKNYKKFLKLKSYLGRTQISRKLQVPIGTVDGWFRGKVPYPLRTVKKLRQKGLIPVKADLTSKFRAIIHCFAFVFGDGSIPEGSGLSYVYFYGQHKDLEKLERKIKKHFKIKTKLIDRSVKNSWLVISDGPFTKLLVAMGAPVGDKSIKEYCIPQWLKEASQNIKKEFVEVLIANEICTPHRIKKASFDHVRFKIRKEISKIDSATDFLDELRELVENFGIKTKSTKVIWSEKVTRKDRNITVACYFEIDENRVNILKFWKTLKLRYAHEKQTKFDNDIKDALPYLEDQLEDCELYEKVLELRSKGLGPRRICKKLMVPNKVHRISNWIYGRCKPRALSTQHVLKSLLGPVEKIEEKERVGS